MYDFHQLNQSVVQVIKDIPCRPDNVNYPNAPTTSNTLPYCTLIPLTQFNSLQFQDDSSIQTILFQIDIVTDKDAGSLEMNDFVSAIYNAFRPAKQYDGFQVVTTPDINIIGDDGKGYRASLTITIRCAITN